MSVSMEEYDMLAMIDKKLLELTYNQGCLKLPQVIEIIDENTSDREYWDGLSNLQVAQLGREKVIELEERFRDNVECELFLPEPENKSLIISPDAIWVLSQIMQEEYDENGEVVALVLPNFDMEEYE